MWACHGNRSQVKGAFVKGMVAGRVVCLAGLAAVTLGAASYAAGASEKGASSTMSSKGSVSLMYSSDYELDTTGLTTEWYDTIKKEFQAQNPGYTLALQPVGGTDIDEQTKISLALRSASTSPCIMAYETTSVTNLEASGYLLPLNRYLSPAPAFWKGMPTTIKNLNVIDGKVYAVASGYNVSQLYYNKAMLRKAGIKLPWDPRTWSDIVSVAKKVKAANPKVIPLWLHAGLPTGSYVTYVQTLGNLIDGTQTPTTYENGKWVINSPGIRAALGFYKTVFSDGLGEPVGDALNPEAAVQVPGYLKSGQVAIALGSNWFPGAWVFKFATPWPQAREAIGVTPVPTEFGQSPGYATTLAGWTYSISAACAHPAQAWKAIEIMENTTNSVNLANWAGFVPPTTAETEAPAFVDFAPPQGEFKSYAAFATPVASGPGYGAYTEAFATATGEIAQTPSVSLSSVLNQVASTTTTAIGASGVTTIG